MDWSGLNISEQIPGKVSGAPVQQEERLFWTAPYYDFNV